MFTGINHSRNYKYRRLSNNEIECTEALIGDDGKENGEEEHEYLELQKREINNRNRQQQNKSNGSTSSTPEKDIILVDKPIVAGESLASISLRYRISISELKKVNKIQKDIEFYALSSVKIPVRTNSALMDILNDEMQSDIPPSPRKEVSTLEPLDDKHIEAVKLSIAKRESRILDADVNSQADIPASHNIKLYSTAEDKLLGTCSGADWDLSWWKLLLIGVIFFLGVPLLYYVCYVQTEK